MGKRNPNGYGCVTKLKGNRSRPWVVKVTVYNEDGRGRQIPIDYAETEEQALVLLAQYNNNPWNIDRNKVTLVELFNRWAKIKLPKLGESNRESLKVAFKHCSKYYGMKYRNLRAYQMQDCIDNCGRSYSTQGAIKNLWGHLDRFAFECDIIEKMYSTLTTAPPIPETSRTPFTDEQIAALWKIADDPWVNTVDWYFQGGIKSASGRDRIVPIHRKIQPLVKSLVDQGNTYLFSYQGQKLSQAKYYKFWNQVMKKLMRARPRMRQDTPLKPIWIMLGAIENVLIY